MIVSPIGWAGTVYLLFPARTPQPRVAEELALDLTKCVLRIARPRKSSLFSSFPVPPISPESLDLPGISRAPLEESKGQSDTGGYSRPLWPHQAPPTVPRSPGLPCPSSSPSGLPISRSVCEADLGLDPSLPLVILLAWEEVSQAQPSPQGRQTHGNQRFLILGSPDRALRAVLLRPHPMSSHAPSSRAPPASPTQKPLPQ